MVIVVTVVAAAGVLHEVCGSIDGAAGELMWENDPDEEAGDMSMGCTLSRAPLPELMGDCDLYTSEGTGEECEWIRKEAMFL